MPTIVMRCPVCGHISIGEIGFHHCPICKCPVEFFKPDTTMDASGNWDTKSILLIHEMAETGHYTLEGKGTTRSFLNLDDLVFLPSQIARMPLLESENVKCEVIFGKTAKKPIIAKTPVLNAGMSFGIATQNPTLRTRLNVDEKAKRVANFIRASTNEIKAIARICGKSDIHAINRNDLAALTSEMARIAGVNLA